MANMINRQNAEALIEDQLIAAIQQDTPKTSVFMQLAKKLPNMTSNQTKMRVLDILPMAYWVAGDTGQKQTSTQAWDKVYLTAEELAVIIPIPEAVLEDASIDIMGEVQPRVLEAMGQRIDEATLFGVNRPASWHEGIVPAAMAAGNKVESAGDLFKELMGEDGVIAKVEASGRMVNGIISGMPLRAKLRGLVGTDGHPIFKSDMQGPTQYSLDGAPMYFPDNGSFDNSLAQMVAGDFSQAVYAIRQDVSVKILTEAVIQNPEGKIVYNLPQQDMIALRVVFRMGWALPNPATRMDMERKSFPFAYLAPAVTEPEGA